MCYCNRCCPVSLKNKRGRSCTAGLEISLELLEKESITNSHVHLQIYNVHYTMSINGKLQDGSMEIDARNNLETFKMGSGAEEAIEVNDFQNVSIFHAFRECNQASLRDSSRSSLLHTHPRNNHPWMQAACPRAEGTTLENSSSWWIFSVQKK